MIWKMGKVREDSLISKPYFINSKMPLIKIYQFLLRATEKEKGLPWWLSGKESVFSARQGSIPGSGKAPGEGSGLHRVGKTETDTSTLTSRRRKGDVKCIESF